MDTVHDNTITEPGLIESIVLESYTHTLQNKSRFVTEVDLNEATPAAKFPIKVFIKDTPDVFPFDDIPFGRGGADIRFLDTSGKQQKYWIESWSDSGKNATIWVNVTVAGTTQFYMTYGNVEMVSSSNGNLVFPLFDDFSYTSLSDPVFLSKWTYGQSTPNNDATILFSGGKIKVRSQIIRNTVDKSCRMLVVQGFANWIINQGTASGTTTSDSVYISSEYTSTKSARFQSTKLPNTSNSIVVNCNNGKVQNYEIRRLASGSMSTFKVNGTNMGSYTSVITYPTSSIPVYFLARGMEYGPGLHYGAWIKSKTSFGPGYAVQIKSSMSGNYLTTAGAGECWAEIDYVFVRPIIYNPISEDIFSVFDEQFPIV
ncbi:MAG: DUF2341 domain-containing protein [Candidatus Lokiarchaeota archaeon]|nr:DUF2341 domain-containing protein [Candidatus Lokiarchaeota archaeon]